jgi:glucosamine-6-phosphate isomerase
VNKIICRDYDSLSVFTARLIAELVNQKPDALLCFPAGNTSLGTFAELIKMQNIGEVDFSKVKIVGLDEWLSLGEKSQGNCYHFLQKHLLTPLGISRSQICFFDGESSDTAVQCAKTDAFIFENNGIDLMLLGVGMNGHLALNEPGTSFDLWSHVVELDSVTRNVGQKYFESEVTLNRGITLGMKHILNSHKLLVQVSGSAKASLIKRFDEVAVSTDFPMSAIKLHEDALLILDEAACSKG